MLGSGQTCRTLDIRAGRPVLGLQGSLSLPTQEVAPPLLELSLLLGSPRTQLPPQTPAFGTLLSGQEMGSGVQRIRAQIEGAQEDQKVCMQGHPPPQPRAHTGDQEALGSLSFWWEGTQSEICKAVHLRLEPHGVDWWPCRSCPQTEKGWNPAVPDQGTLSRRH